MAKRATKEAPQPAARPFNAFQASSQFLSLTYSSNSTAAGAAILGNPWEALAWLARRASQLGRPLQAGHMVLAGALADALVHAKEGVRLADATGEMALQLMIRVALTWVLLRSGRLHEAVAVSEEAERLSHGDPEAGADILGFSPYGSVLTLRAAALAFLAVQMLFIPCAATIAIMRQELGSWRWTIFSILLLLALSVGVGIAIYQGVTLLNL